MYSSVFDRRNKLEISHYTQTVLPCQSEKEVEEDENENLLKTRILIEIHILSQLDSPTSISIVNFGEKLFSSSCSHFSKKLLTNSHGNSSLKSLQKFLHFSYLSVSRKNNFCFVLTSVRL
jgi:hypothetical protein